MNKYWRIAPIVLAMVVLFGFGGKAHADYVEGDFVDNGLFTDWTAMSQSAIQNFLTAEGSGIASMNFSTNGDTLPDGQQNGSAAYIIAYAAQHFGLSPRTILATMQKEQSLVTDPSPSASQLNYAMGYGCPDTGSCSHPGFYVQVMDGAWQLRFNYERASGNNSNWISPDGTSWGASNITYPCASKPGGSPWFYDRGLYPNTNVDFSDGNNNVYDTIFIANSASASLYCYTPHAYKPGLYTGSFNFVNSWEAWWGESTPAYAAAYDSESSYPTITQGDNASAYIQFRNTGNITWLDDVSNGGWNGSVHLAATDPINRVSAFGATWPAPSRPANTFSTVYESDGTTLAPNQHQVAPGEIGRFTFTLTAGSNQPPGFYQEYFQPILEGAQNWSLGSEAYMDLDVAARSGSATYRTESASPTLYAGQTAPAYFELTNNTNGTWHDQQSATLSAVAPIRLAATMPINRCSVFGGGWPNCERPSTVLSQVYQPDGTTLAPDQHSVAPGQIGKFAFTFDVPTSAPSGTFREYFQPILEGASNWNLSGLVNLDVTILPTSFSPSYDSESAFPTIAKGSSTQVYFQFKNTGNTDWYDSTDAPGGIAPMHLAGTYPINRISQFSSGWPYPSRPAVNFSKVYESDGTTLASNQHMVAPGQIGQFAFTLTAPSNIASGTYQEFFQPILEGASNYNVGGVVYLNVTVP